MAGPEIDHGVQPKSAKNDDFTDESQGRLSSAVDWAREHHITPGKSLLAAAGIVFTPFFVDGLLQTRDVLDAAVYAGLQILTIHSDSAPSPHEVSTLISNIVNGSPDTGAQISGISQDLQATWKGFLLDAGAATAAVTFVQRFTRKDDLEKQAILEGRAKLKSRKRGLVITLGGDGSHILKAVVDGQQSGFIPVVETTESAIALADGLFEGKHPRRPFCISLNVPSEEKGISYLTSPYWENLDLTEENLIQTANGEVCLMVVGIGPGQDRELSFGEDSVVVSQEDLRSAGFRLRKMPGLNGKVDKKSLVDVYVGNGKIKRRNMETGRETMTDRDLAKSTGVDIYVDTWEVALRALVDQLVSSGAKEVRLATSDVRNHGYRKIFGEQFAAFVAKNAPNSGLVFEPETPSANPTWIVYEGRSEDTFMAARQLRKRHQQDKLEPNIIALVTTDLEDYAEIGGLKNIKLVNISAIISEMLNDVKYMLREGMTPSEIQTEIDEFKLPLAEDYVIQPVTEPATSTVV